MRWWVVFVAMLASFATPACGDDGPAALDPPVTASSVPSRDTLVVARRAMSDTEWDRIDDDGAGGVLDCPKYGESTWDYGPIGPGDRRGRSPDDALLDAVRQLKLPERGWVDLARDDKHYFVLDATSWRSLVVVSGDASLGVWRHANALICDPPP
jgi:hypothetical protein